MSEEKADYKAGQESLTPYHRVINGRLIDVYDILDAYRDTIGNPAIEHAIKKLLVAGKRNTKTREQDLLEAIASIYRAMEIEQQQ